MRLEENSERKGMGEGATRVCTFMTSIFSRKQKIKSLIKNERPRATQYEERGRIWSICFRKTMLIRMARKSIAKENVGSIRIENQFLTVDPLGEGQIQKTPIHRGSS